MTAQTMTLIEYLRKCGLDTRPLSWGERAPDHSMLNKAEVEERVGAAPQEGSPERTNQRNGYRDRLWVTRVGPVPLRIPKLRPRPACAMCGRGEGSIAVEHLAGPDGVGVLQGG